jgi:hypothetical protein
MLLIPFFFRRLGVKWMILVGMLAWVARYLLFALGAPDQVVWMLFLAVALHGVCYDFFFVTGFMYTDRVAPREVRSQAQSLLVFFTQGLGMFIGYKIAYGIFLGGQTTVFGRPVNLAGLGTGVPDYTALDTAISGARGEQSLSFAGQLVRMFSVNVPDAVDPALLSQSMADWKVFWLLPAAMAGVISIVFFLCFWDKVRVAEASDEVVAETAEAPEEMP